MPGKFVLFNPLPPFLPPFNLPSSGDHQSVLCTNKPISLFVFRVHIQVRFYTYLYLSSSDWLPSLSLTPSRSIHVVASSKMALFLMVEKYSIEYMFTVYTIYIPSLFIHPEMNTSVVCVLVIVNSYAVNMRLHIFFKLVFSFCVDKCPEVELLGHAVVLFLTS